MTQPLLLCAVLLFLFLPVAAVATIHELRADPERTPVEAVVIAPVGPRIAELEEAYDAVARRLDHLSGHGQVAPSELGAVVNTLADLGHRLAALAADEAELRYWTRQAVEREQMAAWAWRGGLAERDARRLQEAVRARLDHFSADEAALHRLEERLARLTAAATDLAARPPAPAGTADTTP